MIKLYCLCLINVIMFIGCQSIDSVKIQDQILQPPSLKSNVSIIGLHQNKQILLNHQQIKDRLFITHGNILFD